MSTLKIAIQKSGRLNEDSLKLLKECGIAIDHRNAQLKATARNFPLEVFYLRNGDIPQYLEDGVVDIAILGENTLIEKGENLPIVERLGFSKCKVSLAVPKNVEYTGIAYFEGKRIATSYTNTLAKYLNDKGINASFHKIAGSVEIAPNIGLADGICDIVSSGGTLFANGLKEAEVMFWSEAVLTSSPKLSEDKQALLAKLQFRIQSILKGRANRYVLLNAPNDKVDDIIKVIPGMKSPTVLPLAQEGWSSIHTVIPKDKFWDILDELKALGAEGILTTEIEKMVL
ncbi:ATP phosphoribosyltransferase [Ochrovirga pacifica]|uniref:ATP phosphoribosyltransferase n=1 Tax=Ochrovirga pacifica TaxID=1042376 RepID=UPI0002558728|nr:ATP phosphoribosyltransferase [Ochrovirga pacifica]